VRLTDRAQQRTRTASAKTVVTNTPIELPAGAVTVTATVEAQAQGADSVSRGSNQFELHLSRTQLEGGLALDVPLASARAEALGFLGELSVNASFNAREVSGFGALNDWTYGVAWSPLPGVQLLATARRSAAAPDMTQLSSPVVRIPNATVYDLTNATTALVTVVQGGNPDLLAMRRESRLLTLNLKPFQARELRLAVTYEAARIHDQTGTVYAITPQTEALLPDLFLRDPSGRLVSVAYQPTNFALERQRTLTVTLNANGRIGKPPPPPPPGSSGGVRFVPSYFGGIGPTIRFADRLQLRPGAPELDLLDGDTITGVGTARVSGYFYGGFQLRRVRRADRRLVQRADRRARGDPGRRPSFLVGFPAQPCGLRTGPSPAAAGGVDQGPAAAARGQQCHRLPPAGRRRKRGSAEPLPARLSRPGRARRDDHAEEVALRN
jgi:hypothetical protein